MKALVISVVFIVSVLFYIETKGETNSKIDSYSLTLDDRENAQEELDGADLYKKNCKVCHSLEREKLGPALSFIQEVKSKEWFIDFTIDPVAMIKSGDVYTNCMVDKFKSTMNSQEHLSRDEVGAIYEYVVAESANLVKEDIGGIEFREICME